MQQTKAQTGIIIFSIFFLLVIILTVILVYISMTGNKEEELEKNMELFIKSNVNTDYIILDNGSLVNSGKSYSTHLTPVKLAVIPYKLYCMNKDKYSSEQEIVFTDQEIKSNKAKRECILNDIGVLQISHKGNLSNNQIQLNITSKYGEWRKLSLCNAWSVGIIRASTNGEEIEIPLRFAGKKDYCINTNISLSKDQSLILIINLETLENMNYMDYLEITFFDYDRIYDGEIKWVSEINGENIAGGDIEYLINHEN